MVKKQDYNKPKVYIQENGIRYWQYNGKRGLVVEGTDGLVRYFPADYDKFYGNINDGFLLAAKSVWGGRDTPVDWDIDNYSSSEAYSHTELDLLCVDGVTMPLDLCHDSGSKISYEGRSNIDGAITFRCRYKKNTILINIIGML